MSSKCCVSRFDKYNIYVDITFCQSQKDTKTVIPLHIELTDNDLVSTGIQHFEDEGVTPLPFPGV